MNREVMERCNEGGELFFSQTVLAGQTVLRLATSGVETREQLRRDWGIIVKHLEALIVHEQTTQGMKEKEQEGR